MQSTFNWGKWKVFLCQFTALFSNVWISWLYHLQLHKANLFVWQQDMIISNYKLGCTDCGNIPLEFMQVWICFTAALHMLQAAAPSRKAVLQLLNSIWDVAFGGEAAVKLLLSISLLAANSTSTVYLSTQLVGIPNSRWINTIRNVTTAQGNTECAQSARETLTRDGLQTAAE